MTSIILITVFVLCVGCSRSIGDGSGGSDGAQDTRNPGPDTGDEPPPDEICNGVDDDGDGQVDEGFPDIDRDSVADCVDEDCVVEPIAEMAIEVVEDLWETRLEWEYTNGQGVVGIPAVGQLTDDNGDGQTDEHDLPDVALISQDPDELVVLSGDGGEIHFSAEGYRYDSGLAIADVNGDGRNEVLALNTEAQVVALGGDGSIVWTSAPLVGLDWYPTPSVGDLDGDGTVEIVFNRAVLNGADGSLRGMLPYEVMWTVPAIGDVNGDGASEIAYGRGLYDQNGELLWSFGSGLYAMGSSFLAIVQLDGDPEGELVVLRSDALESRMLLFEHDGVLIKDVPISEPITGPAAFADFDGDGAHEIAVPAQTVLYLFEMDGSVAWTAPIDDWSGSSGCAGFDFDADGIAEVVYGDQDTLWILDGKSGEELHSVVRGSGTSFGTPIIVDLDADGAAEILFTSNLLARSGVHVLGQSSGRWAGTGRTWPQHDYAVTNLTADGRPGVEPAWLADNLIRVRPVADVPFPAIPDLTLVSGDHCFASCEDGPARIALGVANIGDGAVASGASLRLYSETKDGLEPVGEAFLDAVPPESQIPAAAMRVPRAHWGRPLVAQVDEGDAIIERREDNNRISIPPILCE